jgi:putative endonuclease
MNPAPLSSYYVYVLKSKRSKKLYIGCTSNIEKRLKKHNEGAGYYTRRLLPLELIYAEIYKSKKDAFEREKKLKYHGSALRNLKLRIENTLQERGAG